LAQCTCAATSCTRSYRPKSHRTFDRFCPRTLFWPAHTTSGLRWKPLGNHSVRTAATRAGIRRSSLLPMERRFGKCSSLSCPSRNRFGVAVSSSPLKNAGERRKRVSIASKGTRSPRSDSSTTSSLQLINAVPGKRAECENRKSECYREGKAGRNGRRAKSTSDRQRRHSIAGNTRPLLIRIPLCDQEFR